MLDTKAFVAEMVRSVRVAIDKALDPLRERLGTIESTLKDTPAPKDGKDADPQLVRDEVAKAVAELPAPDLKAIAALVESPTAEQVAALIKAPADGKDAEPEVIRRAVDDAVAALPAQDLEAIAALVSVPTAEEIAALVPAPRDGNDADPERIKEAVAEAVAALPAPDLHAIAALVPVAVVDQAAIAALIPVPKDGKDADPEAVAAALEPAMAARIDEMVKQAIAKLPKAVDGKDAEPKVIEQMVRDATQDIKPGEPGRDGLQIDVLEAVDVERSYPRGTFVRHAGGMLRSFRTTDKGAPVEASGWQVILDGIAEVAVEFGEDLRSVGIAVRRTSGAEVFKQIEIPTVVYRGTYVDGKKYARGDSVTWAGSTWHCNEPTDQKPGNSKAWTLSTKKGRDGSDAVLKVAELQKQVRLG